MIKYVFLDLDDTILDFHRAEAVALKKTLTHMGIPPTDATVTRYSEINDAQWKLLEKGVLTRAEVKLRRFQLLFEELGVEANAEEARRYYEEQLGVGHYFMPGAEALLQALHGRYRLFIMSNGTTAVQKGRIESAGIAPLFEAIFLSEQIGFVKPQKEFFDACFAEIPDFDPAQAIILGDSLTSDILGGINAGVRTCWFNPHGTPRRADIIPDFEITSLDEFVPLIKRL
jgi:2-haloacid dehalogenase